ncbi:hypothetical protein F2Q70_00002774 [Brassica cretica]|uniref:Uncharacterized protein n=1 Tax=Brassica cretica TaxID=69181 RepID=A0A8S9J3S0_BRACR|nr:hypothetical protein F2Q70_00002774 [Brassica cretica]
MRIHDPVPVVGPCAVFEAESPIPPDRSMQFSSYNEVLDDHQHVEASQRVLRFRDEVDKGPAEAASIDTDQIPSIDTNTLPSIDTTTASSIDSGRLSEQKDFDVCGNLRDGDTTTRSDKSGGKKRRNWKTRKRIKGDFQLSFIPRFSYGLRKSRSITSIDQSPLNCVDRQSLKSIDRNLTVLVGSHIKVRNQSRPPTLNLTQLLVLGLVYMGSDSSNKSGREQSKSCFSRRGKQREHSTWIKTPTPAPSKPVKSKFPYVLNLRAWPWNACLYVLRMAGSFPRTMAVGTKIRTVDFRLNKETRKTLISQRSRISANTTRQANQNTIMTTKKYKNRKKRAKRSLIPNLRMSVYNKRLDFWFELGRYVATELRLELGRYIATERNGRFGRYVATELWLKLGRYVATERSTCLVAA